MTDRNGKNGQTVAVVGAGPAGLAAAFRLQQAGCDVRVFEAGSYVGGRMKTIQRDGFLIEEGAALLPSTYRNLLGIAREIGLGDEIVAGGTQFAIPTGQRVEIIDCAHLLWTGTAMRSLSPRSKLLLARLAVESLRHRSSIASGDLSTLSALDDETVAAYALRRLNPQILDVVIDPALRGIAGDSPERLSKVDLFYMINLFAGRMRPLTFRSGISTYAEALAQRLNVRTDTTVTRITDDNAAVSVTSTHGGVEHTERFDGCVLAIPPKNVLAVHPDLDSERAGFLGRARSTAIVNLTVALGRRPAAGWTYMPIPAHVEPDLLLIALFHHYGPGRVPPGKAQVGIYPAPDLSARLFAAPEDVCVRELLERTERVVPGLIDSVEFTHLNRWDPLLFVSWPGYYRELARFQAITARLDRRVTLAGDYYSVSSMNSATSSGERAAERLLRLIDPRDASRVSTRGRPARRYRGP